jgi:hypothetical protein
MAIQLQREGQFLTVTVSGDFLVGDVSRIGEALHGLEKVTAIAVDFTRARYCESPALLGLLDVLAAVPVAHELVGLSESNRRMVSYLRPARPPPKAGGEGGR